MPATADHVKLTTTACKLSIKWFGTSRALEPEQTRQAAETFDADARMLNARKKIIDTKNPAWKDIVKIKTQAQALWKDLTTPYPDPGVRLIKKDLIEVFANGITALRNQLLHRVADFNTHCYTAMRNNAQERLGQLFNPDDYPPTLDGEFDIAWEFPSVEPPIDLKSLYPAIYEQEQKKAEAKLQEAVTLAEQAFASELSAMVKHLAERLVTSQGEKKIFRDSAVTNFQEFFTKFASLKISDNTELDQVVANAKKLLSGIAPEDLRKNETLKTDLAGSLATVSKQLEGMIVKQRRKIVIPDSKEAAA